MAEKKTTKNTSKKTNSNTKKKTTTKVEVKEKELATDFVEEKKKKEKPKKEKVEVKKETKPEKEEVKEKKPEKVEKKQSKHIFVHTFLIILLLVSLGSFVISILDKNSSIYELVSGLLLTIFTIFFVTISISYHRKKKGTIFICGLLLLCYFLINLNSHVDLVDTPIATVDNFQGKTITEVIKWANKNNIKINQDYEYSDMVPEYNIISQDIKSGTTLSGVKEITVSVSEGPNPDKEVIIPNMITWDDERVINFVKDNYLNNVTVDFISSDKAKDTVIEQSVSGSSRRSSELHLIFSYGEELGFSEVKLIDFTDMSKFEVEFYMKKNQLRYEFDEAFSSKIKRGNAMKQSIAAGEVVQVNDERVLVTISKGPKIKVPDLTKMSLEEITEWAIKNKVRLTFTDQYDEKIKENDVISFGFKEGSIIEQGTVVKIVLSRGALKMPKFASLTDFYNWVNKYGINYEEKHEFSDTVKAGEIIKFSYKTGEAIKNGDTIIVTISDGEKQEVPSLIGLTKSEAISKLESAHLNYSFVYEDSSYSKNKVINQSISAGSQVSSGTTVTVTLSTGEVNTQSEERRSSNNSNNSSSNNSSSNNNNSNTTPVNNCSNVTVYIYDELISNVPSTTCSRIKSAYPSLKFSCSYVQDGGLANGLLKNATSIDGETKSTCETINLVIVNNN